jgi:hypothetical protein
MRKTFFSSWIPKQLSWMLLQWWTHTNKVVLSLDMPIHWDQQSGHQCLYDDYFAENLIYPEKLFYQCFCMCCHVFLWLVDALIKHDEYFVQKRDSAGILRLSPLQKVTAAVCQLAYGASPDAVDDYVCIGESTALESLKWFCRGIVEVFGGEYLRSPTAEDM